MKQKNVNQLLERIFRCAKNAEAPKRISLLELGVRLIQEGKDLKFKAVDGMIDRIVGIGQYAEGAK